MRPVARAKVVDEEVRSREVELVTARDPQALTKDDIRDIVDDEQDALCAGAAHDRVATSDRSRVQVRVPLNDERITYMPHNHILGLDVSTISCVERGNENDRWAGDETDTETETSVWDKCI